MYDIYAYKKVKAGDVVRLHWASAYGYAARTDTRHPRKLPDKPYLVLELDGSYMSVLTDGGIAWVTTTSTLGILE